MKESDFCLYVAGVLNRQLGCGGIGLAENLAALEERSFKCALDALHWAWVEGQGEYQLVPERILGHEKGSHAKELGRLLGANEAVFRLLICYLSESEWSHLKCLLQTFRTFRRSTKAA